MSDEKKIAHDPAAKPGDALVLEVPKRGGKTRILGTLAALLGAAAPAIAPPTAPLPPAAIVHDFIPRQSVVKPFRPVPKTPKAIAATSRARDKRNAKHAYRRARRVGAPAPWREAHRRARFWEALMATGYVRAPGGTRALWANVHAARDGAL